MHLVDENGFWFLVSGFWLKGFIHEGHEGTRRIGGNGEADKNFIQKGSEGTRSWFAESA
jgi:hypothetical protein